MHLTVFLALAGSAAALVAVKPRQDDDACAAWEDVAADILGDWSGSCTDDARAAIRMSFHDCFPEACDGSLILSDDECSRAENTQMSSMCSTLKGKASDTVNGADLVQLAAALGVKVCKGPVVDFFVGRTASTTANPTGQMPGAGSSASSLVTAFAAKGLTADDLVALVGTHSTAKNLGGQALDSTVDTMDVKYYEETADGSAPATVPADRNLANGTDTSDTWSQFAGSQSDWEAAFVSAMNKMTVIGNDKSSLTDCSSIIQNAQAKLRRRS